MIPVPHGSTKGGIVTETTKRLEPGDHAPDFTLNDADGNPVTLSEVVRGAGSVVLYFYPAAMTPGCTKEACDFRDNLSAFADSDLRVLGVSPDTVEKLRAFRDAEKLNFTLLSDPDREALTAYGAYGEKKNYGKVVRGVIRSTFVINADLTIAKAFYNVRATGHVDRIKRELGV
ncbi:thioredoxin-dependent thiol peroxidase [Spiractinospora alimapuensis]|uniref:thioredoxin-dependent thiol peroxidase n=1 Tax=Spiractinospora alimapuensis TaxID=2820884 RepID=UPI001EE9F486|nr:thioredoxin-dependent thiol peroxidase [Spiractinospora alimapuensis]QVQ54828.1 thioredoxin-dependent thiol peroxidase [Spiractinospora alimapuensis]